MGKMKTANVSEEDKNKQKHDKAHQKDEGKVHVAGLKGGQRVTIVEAAPTEEAPVVTEDGQVRENSGKKKPVERVRGKKYKEAKTKYDHEKLFPVKEGVKLVKDSSYSKFDGTMELHLVLKKAGTSANVTLPFQAGKVKKVEIADEDTIAKLKEGKTDFDILVATTAMMPKLVPFARILGPKGLMPNPKNGTLVADEKQAKKFSTGSILIKTEKEAPLVHTVVGKNSQKDEEIAANVEAVLKALGGSKQIVKVYMKSSMSPSVKLLVK
jgi:large subunit ribosomal protein L1